MKNNNSIFGKDGVSYVLPFVLIRRVSPYGDSPTTSRIRW